MHISVAYAWQVGKTYLYCKSTPQIFMIAEAVKSTVDTSKPAQTLGRQQGQNLHDKLII